MSTFSGALPHLLVGTTSWCQLIFGCDYQVWNEFQAASCKLLPKLRLNFHTIEFDGTQVYTLQMPDFFFSSLCLKIHANAVLFVLRLAQPAKAFSDEFKIRREQIQSWFFVRLYALLRHYD